MFGSVSHLIPLLDPIFLYPFGYYPIIVLFIVWTALWARHSVVLCDLMARVRSTLWQLFSECSGYPANEDLLLLFLGWKWRDSMASCDQVKPSALGRQKVANRVSQMSRSEDSEQRRMAERSPFVSKGADTKNLGRELISWVTKCS